MNTSIYAHEQTIKLAAVTAERDALRAALETITSIPGLTTYEAHNFDARTAWHVALREVYSKARAVLGVQS